MVSAKGAPEAIADLCHLSEDEQERLNREVAALASQGRDTLDARLDLLESHRGDVQEHIRELEDKLAIIEAKIKIFKDARGKPEASSGRLVNK